MADKNEYASFTNATTENVTTRPDQVNRQLDPNYTEIAKLMSIAAGIVIINSVVFYLFFKKKTLRTASNYPLFSLAACDFFCGSVIIPLFTIFSFTPLVESQKIKFYVGFLVTVLHNFVAIATVYHIVVVTAERYMAIKFPLKHRLLHLNCICKVLAIVWIGSVLISFSPFTWINKMYPVFQPVSLKFTLGFTIFCMVFALLLPYIFLIYAFVSMFKAISGSPSPNKNQQTKLMGRKHSLAARSTGERKCLLLFATMAIVFLICWLPWFVIFLLYQLPLDYSKLEVPSHVALIVRYMTSVVNPLLYTFLKRDFHRALKFVFSRQGSRQVSATSSGFSIRRGTLQADPNPKPVISFSNGNCRSQLTSLNTQCFESAL